MTVVAVPVGAHHRIEIDAVPGDPIGLAHVGDRGGRYHAVFLTPGEARELARILRLAADAAERRSTEFVMEPDPSDAAKSRRARDTRWGVRP